MWFRVEANEIVMQIPNDRVITGGDVVEWRIFDYVPAVTHRVFDAFNRVARCASESGLGGRVYGDFHEWVCPSRR